jgi:hypothetical protein
MNVDGQPDGEFSAEKEKDFKREMFGLLNSPRHQRQEREGQVMFSTGLEAEVASKRGEPSAPISIQRRRPPTSQAELRRKLLIH